MKIRTSLVLACFLLSVLPLGGIVIYSYYSSRAALESAYHAEAGRMTAQMDRRLGNIRDVLEQRLAEVSALPNLSNPEKEKSPVVGNILMTMGDAASLVDSIEIRPMFHPRPAAVTQATATPATAAAPPTPPPLLEESIVIDLPPMPKLPRFAFTDEQLGKGRNTLTAQQRQDLTKQLNAAQTAFTQSMKATQKQFNEELSNAQKARQDNLKIRQKERETERADAQREAEQERIQAEKEAAADAADAAQQAQDEAAADIHQGAKASEKEKQHWRMREKQATLLFGHRFNVPMTSAGAVVGQLRAHVSGEEVIRRLLGAANDENGEITFAVDREGNIYARTPEERRTLDKLGIPQRIAAGKTLNDIPNWVVVQHREPLSGLRIGVARPFGEDLEGLRKTAARNFGYGIALIFVALIGIMPIANHITRDVDLVKRGAERIAHGDLTTRIPVRSKNEIGHLASAFNRMAEDLSLQQERIVEQERAAIVYERKSVELEEARRFQLSMLPKEVPQLKEYNIAVFTHTATEVGGDYYDFHVEPGRSLSITIGDATGHGARAGTMVAVIKALFAGYGGVQSPAEFLHDATERVRRMDLGRMAMALQLARFEGRRVTVASAGMPPAYLHRASNGTVEEVAHSATPLGTLGNTYNDITLDLEFGDTLLFMSDGFPELMNAAGQQLGYSAAADAFAAAAKAGNSDGVIAELAGVVRGWHGDQAPNDDVTFVVVRAT
jgi:serine phosphatase RsbU (regulator of sigma subunit)